MSLIDYVFVFEKILFNIFNYVFDYQCDAVKSASRVTLLVYLRLKS